MAEVVGSLAIGMAGAPLAGAGENVVNGKVVPDTDKKGVKGGKGKNPILAYLGTPQFIAGDGKQYPRQEGWGANKKPHSGGGTNETVAFVVFKPFAGLELSQEGRIYCERFVEGGKNKRRYSISLPFLKADKRDGDGRRAVEDLKGTIKAQYQKWEAEGDHKAETKASKANESQWEEVEG